MVFVDVSRMQYGTKNSFKARLQLYFIENQETSLIIRLFNVVIKILSCVLYAVRVICDIDAINLHTRVLKEGEVQYENLFFAESNFYIWLSQTVVAILSIFQTFVIFYITYQGSIAQTVFSSHFLLEMVTSFPFVLTIFFPSWRNVYIPAFLNCWLARGALKSMMNDLDRGGFVRRSALFRELVLLYATVICLVFTGMCSIEHLQRAGNRHFDFFTSFYFVIVTFSTVGYGDWFPDTWMSRMCVTMLIVCTVVLLPSQIERLNTAWQEKQKSGGDYSSWKYSRHEHVVIAVTYLQVEFVSDFLDEFYAHSENQRVRVILLSPSELDNQTRSLLKSTLWFGRVYFVRGSALKDEDLQRACVAEAKACFILSARHQDEKASSDEQTILRSWAIKDFAPHVKQFVQVFLPETKMHIDHAEVVVCEDEFKYSLMANSVTCPGISTFLTLLIHTSRGEEGQSPNSEVWQQVCGFHSGNELYHIRVDESRFFDELAGKTFSSASFYAHNRYGVGLMAVKSCHEEAKIRLNPGKDYILQASDTVYYMALTNEESLFDFKDDLERQHRQAKANAAIINGENDGDTVNGTSETEVLSKSTKHRSKTLRVATAAIRLGVAAFSSSKKPKMQLKNENSIESSSGSDTDSMESSCFDIKCFCTSVCLAKPKTRTYIGTSSTVCHSMKRRRPECCLQLDKVCLAHNKPATAKDHAWRNPPIIVAVDNANTGLCDFIIPLRAFYRPVHELHPIVIVIDDENDPGAQFLEAIAWFPLVYWMKGRMSNVDNFLKAGITYAAHVIIVKSSEAIVEEHLADCSTIITVQKIHKMFPKLRMTTELVHASNMRFVYFNPESEYALAQSEVEKQERKRGSTMPFIFRLPFAQGGVFSANMMDRLLYQAIIKPFVVDFTRLLLGLDQSENGGFLTSFEVTASDLWLRTYGKLYKKLTSSAGDIPIGIFRTQPLDKEKSRKPSEASQAKSGLEPDRPEFERSKSEASSCHCTHSIRSRNKEMWHHVLHRMRTMGMTSLDETKNCKPDNTVSFVLINPSVNLKLETGDIIYVLRAPVSQEENWRVNPRRGLRKSTNVTEVSVEVDA